MYGWLHERDISPETFEFDRRVLVCKVTESEAVKKKLCQTMK